MRRPTLSLLVCLLLLVTALALLRLGAAVSAPHPVPGAAGASSGLVHGFYEAVNETLATGDPAGLTDALAPAFVAHGLVPTGALDGAGLATHLIGLRAAYPELRLAVEDLVAARQVVMTRISTVGARRGNFVGLPITGPVGLWGTADSFRIAGGRIAELRSNGGGTASFAPLFAVPLAEAIGDGTAIAVERLRVSAGDGRVPSLDPLPRLVYLEAGALAFSVGDGDRRGEGRPPPLATVRRMTDGADGGTSRTVPPGHSTTLVPGEVLVVPGGTDYALYAPGPVPTIALGLSMAFDSPEIAQSGLNDPVSSWPPTVESERLAEWKIADWPDGSTPLAMGRAVLAPGAAFDVAVPTGAAVLAVETGGAGLARGAAIGPGDSALVLAGGASTGLGIGTAPVTVLVLSILPDNREG